MKRVACYVRVSTDEQKKNGLSVDNQIEALKEYCAENNYHIVDIYNDAGCSARKSYKSRPALLRMIKDCQDGKIDLIIFTKLDRWFRSVGDYYATMEQLNGVPWRAIWEDYEIETSSGIFKVNIMLSVSQSEADRTRERTKATMEYKRAKGDYIGDAPIGYKRQNMRLVKDETTEELINGIFRTYIATHSIKKVLSYCADNEHKLAYSTIDKMLRSRTYVGEAKGTKCEPYLTEEEYQLIQSCRRKCVRVYDVPYTYLFTGIVFCGLCGYRMIGTQYKAKGEVYKAYRCRSTNVNRNHTNPVTISERKIETFLLEQLDTLIANHNLEVKSTAKEPNKDVEKLKAQLEQRIERLGVRYELGDYTTEEYKERRKKLLEELTALNIDTQPTKEVTLPPTWKEVYKSLDEEHKKQYWLLIISKIKIFPDKHIEVEFL